MYGLACIGTPVRRIGGAFGVKNGPSVCRRLHRVAPPNALTQGKAAQLCLPSTSAAWLVKRAALPSMPALVVTGPLSIGSFYPCQSKTVNVFALRFLVLPPISSAIRKARPRRSTPTFKGSEIIRKGSSSSLWSLRALASSIEALACICRRLFFGPSPCEAVLWNGVYAFVQAFFDCLYLCLLGKPTPIDQPQNMISLRVTKQRTLLHLDRLIRIFRRRPLPRLVFLHIDCEYPFLSPHQFAIFPPCLPPSLCNASPKS